MNLVIRNAKLVAHSDSRSRSPLRVLFCAAAAWIALVAWSAAHAQNMPASVRIIVPFSAGGAQDALARELARELGARLAVPFTVDNRPGAGGNIGTDAAAKATPDGSVLVLSSSGPLANNRLFYKSLPYAPDKDFAPVALVGETPLFILAKKSSPYASLGAMLRDAVQGQPPLNFGSAGYGTTSHLALELMRENSLREIRHVPYKGGSQVEIDVMASVLDGGLVLYSAGDLAHAEKGTLRILAVTSNARMAAAPAVPTAVEEGFPMLVTFTWFALVGPRGLPKDYVDRMNREINVYLRTPAGVARLQNLGISVITGPPELVTQRMREELAKWTPIVRKHNLRMD